MTDGDDVRQKSTGSGKSLFKKPVDISKVNLPVIKTWMEQTIHEQLPDDDIVVEFIYEMLQSEEKPDIKAIQEQMTNFLGEEESLIFCKELWSLLLSGQKDPDGIPEQLLQQRKKQLDKETADKAQQMLSQLRLKPDYNRTRLSFRDGHRGREKHSIRDNYQRDTQRDSYRSKEFGAPKNSGRLAGSKTNYNRALPEEESRGAYGRERRWDSERDNHRDRKDERDRQRRA